MRYLMLIYSEQVPDDAWSDEQMKAEMDAYYAFMAEMGQRGVLKGGDALQGTETATTVRNRNGEVLTTDGPFAETKEQLGGYFEMDCKDLDEAIEIAAKIPTATRGSIEVRPIQEFPDAQDS
jgi:hypothetical protein